MKRMFGLLAGCFALLQISGQNIFGEHRSKLLQLMAPHEVAVLKTTDGCNKDGHTYLPESNFFYLTGIERPGYYLILSYDGILIGNKKYNVILFDSENEHLFQVQSVDTILNSNVFQSYLSKVAVSASTFYVSQPDLGFISDWLNARPLFTERDSRKTFAQKYNNLVVKPLGNLISKLRETKSDVEVELMKKAIKATGSGLEFAYSVCTPQLYEYELQAAIEYEITRQGCRNLAFNSIIGSELNGLELHYDRNNCRMPAGALVVMDVGGKYNGYCADISRTIPVSGRFTDDQARYYNIVLQVQKDIIASLKPGVTYGEIDRLAYSLLEKQGLKKYLLHGVTHSLGLDVHDVQPSDTLRPGMVITIEPGVYIPSDDTTQAETMRGNGIRIEDDVLITGSGATVLSSEIPKEIADILSIMKKSDK
jgi:Xaa-Pro aminopeptidase